MKQPEDTATPELPELDAMGQPFADWVTPDKRPVWPSTLTNDKKRIDPDWPFPSTIGKPGDACRPPSSELSRYPGGKNGAGVFQKIINVIPAHTTYVEVFAGSAAIYRRKAAAASSILLELDPAQAELLTKEIPGATVICDDGLDYIDERLDDDLTGWFFYIDPPYLHSTRKDTTQYGQYELDDQSHWHLVEYLLPRATKAGAKFALSGYRSDMYDEAAEAHGWHRTDYQTRTRQGTVIESLWTNYSPAGAVPADLTWAGDNFRERERLKRKAARWTAKLRNMPALERAFIRQALASIDDTGDGA